MSGLAITTYRLTIFGVDDDLVAEIPLTDEQAEAIRSLRTAPPDDPNFQFAEYQIDNVYFGAIRG